MQTHKINKIDIPQTKTELTSLLIQYHLNELPESCMQIIEHKIETCEECKVLYNEISLIHDNSGALLFEIENPDVMNHHEEQLKNLLNTFPAEIDLNEKDKSDVTFYSKSIMDDCDCC